MNMDFLIPNLFVFLHKSGLLDPNLVFVFPESTNPKLQNNTFELPDQEIILFFESRNLEVLF